MSTASLSIAILMEMIKASTRTIEVCVPSQDYYTLPGEWTRDTIEYISPDLLLNELQQLLNNEERNQ